MAWICGWRFGARRSRNKFHRYWWVPDGGQSVGV